MQWPKRVASAILSTRFQLVSTSMSKGIQVSFDLIRVSGFWLIWIYLSLRNSLPLQIDVAALLLLWLTPRLAVVLRKKRHFCPDPLTLDARRLQRALTRSQSVEICSFQEIVCSQSGEPCYIYEAWHPKSQLCIGALLSTPVHCRNHMQR